MIDLTLIRVGLSRSRVMELTGRPVTTVFVAPQAVQEPEKYANLSRQYELTEFLEEFSHVIFTMAACGDSHSDIARLFGVSRECISKRMRPYGLRGVRGKPKKKAPE
jgi:DNA-binding NtrC family response regulator